MSEITTALVSWLASAALLAALLGLFVVAAKATVESVFFPWRDR